MTRRCTITGKIPMVGNNVSHANNKTKRVFNPNIQRASFLSDALGASVTLRVTPRGIRTIEQKGGIDQYVLNTPKRKLDAELLQIKRRVSRRLAAQHAS